MRVRSWIAGRPRTVPVASTIGVCLIAGGLVAPMLASATTPTPSLAIKPSSMFYPCSEGTATFSLKGFPATTQVALRLGSAKATVLRTVETNSSGAGSTSVTFTNYFQGYYTFYATDSTSTAHHLLKIGECP
jgi:hypothetical protein